MNPLPPLLLKGDCLAQLARIPAESVDAIVTDPPYALEFMGKGWDSFKAADFEASDMPMRRNAEMNAVHVSGAKQGGRQRQGLGYQRRQAADMRAFQSWVEQWARECLRILKPGGHMLAFGGSRTWHRLAAGVEDAGFELRDNIAWLYGSGFPKSLDVSKAIDKAAGAEREVTGIRDDKGRTQTFAGGKTRPTLETAPATPEAVEWQGWGTALKPAFEPVVVARKPLAKGMTVAANVLAYGTGALNIDAGRVHADDVTGPRKRHGGGILGAGSSYELPDSKNEQPPGRWPANVMLDESQAAALDAQSGTLTSGANPKIRGGDQDRTVYGGFTGARNDQPRRGFDKGGASRFFYVAKAPKSERPLGADGVGHPTVKPLALMRQLVRLVTPPGGCVVDPFAGSGTTLEAAYLEGFESIGIELTPDYWPLIEARIARVLNA
jgi:DNA modification methylase